jgi:hypothetical protein
VNVISGRILVLLWCQVFGAKVANRDEGFQALYFHVCILRIHGSHVFVILHDWWSGTASKTKSTPKKSERPPVEIHMSQ